MEMLLEDFSSNYLHRCTLKFPKVQTDVPTYSLMLGTSNFAIFVFSICSFHFCISLSYRFLGKLWSRDPGCQGFIEG